MLLNMRYKGGGGGEFASIFVTGLSQTDSVSMVTPSGITVTPIWTSKTIEGETVNGWLFSNLVVYGNYVITASNGAKTKTQNVLIDMAEEQEIKMSFIPSGCIAEYLFDDNVNDTSESGLNLTNYGITFADSGLNGIPKCAVFNGLSSAKSLATVTTTNFKAVSFWIKDVTGGVLLGIAPSSGSSYSWGLWVNGSAKNITSIYGYTNNNNSASASVMFGTSWIHVVVNLQDYNNSSTMSAYVNGTVTSVTSSSSSGSWQSSMGILTVGNRGNAWSEYATCKVAGLRFYDHKLSEEEVAILYNGGSGI